jgi:hypothetical protein
MLAISVGQKVGICFHTEITGNLLLLLLSATD